MAPSTLPNAKTDLYNCFASDAAGTPVSAISAYVGKVYKGEPRPGDLIQANGLATVTIWTGPLLSTSFTFVVRVYQHVDHDVVIAQTNLDAATWAVEGVISAEFERSDWTPAFDPTINLVVFESTITCGRQDF